MPDGRSKGCGIVEFYGARSRLSTLNDTELYGRQIFVREDRRQPPPSSAPFSTAAAAADVVVVVPNSQGEQMQVAVYTLEI
jgi:hypothetical protein